MRHTSGLRPATAILLASALHGLIAAGLLLARQEPPPDDDTVIDVLLAPPSRRAPPSAPARSKPTPAPATARPNAPPSASRQTAPRRTADQGAWRVHEGEGPQTDGLRRTLRAGVGCRSADFLALSKTEREACERELAAGAQDGPTYAVVSPKLKKQFDGVFECPKDDVWCEYRIGKGPYPGLFAPRKKKNPEWD